MWVISTCIYKRSVPAIVHPQTHSYNYPCWYHDNDHPEPPREIFHFCEEQNHGLPLAMISQKIVQYSGIINQKFSYSDSPYQQNYESVSLKCFQIKCFYQKDRHPAHTQALQPTTAQGNSALYFTTGHPSCGNRRDVGHGSSRHTIPIPMSFFSPSTKPMSSAL